MALAKEDRYQRGLHYAIVDEVDSILIDEARTPLIISGPADESQELYHQVDAIVPQLTRQKEEKAKAITSVDEKGKQVHLSEAGMEHVEELLRSAGVLKDEDDALYGAQNIHVVHHLNAACARMRSTSATSTTSCATTKWSSSTNSPAARCRAAAGPTACTRRWKRRNACGPAREPDARLDHVPEPVPHVQKLSGMTGTADTEAYEFQNIYGLEVTVIPTHRPMVRKDHSDLVFLNRAGKYRAVVNEIKQCHERTSPCWSAPPRSKSPNCSPSSCRKPASRTKCSTPSSTSAKRRSSPTPVRPGAVTIATNMAGRGTDIVLGGSLEAELQALGEDASDADKARRARSLAAAP
jgi:preprotein translocase subunit SecA